jgi:hypothetical protein
MAQTREFPLYSQKNPRSLATNYWKTLIILTVSASALVCVSPARAQLQQPLTGVSAPVWSLRTATAPPGEKIEAPLRIRGKTSGR